MNEGFHSIRNLKIENLRCPILRHNTWLVPFLNKRSKWVIFFGLYQVSVQWMRPNLGDQIGRCYRMALLHEDSNPPHPFTLLSNVNYIVMDCTVMKWYLLLSIVVLPWHSYLEYKEKAALEQPKWLLLNEFELHQFFTGKCKFKSPHSICPALCPWFLSAPVLLCVDISDSHGNWRETVSGLSNYISVNLTPP